jgi:hypothetical protein
VFEQESPWSAEAKYLGMHLERRLTWKAQIKAMENKKWNAFHRPTPSLNVEYFTGY